MNDLDRLQSEIYEWGARTFPHRCRSGIVLHLQREVCELKHEPYKREEAADFLILLLHLATIQGYSLFDAAREKFEFCKKREWKSPDAEGVSEHVR